MQEIFKLYSKIHDNNELTPTMFRKELSEIKNMENMWILEIMYSFFMLGYNRKCEYTPINQ
jgi:hypothetical protein